MSAADGLKALETRAASMRLTRWALYSIGALVLLTAAYCAGTHRGNVDTQLAANAAQRDTVRDTIRVLDTLIQHDAPIAAVTKRAADAARDTAHTALAIAQQAVQRADSAHSDSLPASLVLPALHACQTALVADTIAYHAEAALLADMTRSRDAWRHADQVDSARVALLEKERAPRIGWKGGAVIGAGLMALLVHLVK